VAVADPEPLLVDPSISGTKLEAQLVAWEANAADYAARGMHLLGRDGLTVDVAFVARIALAHADGSPFLPIVTACARLAFHNYDRRPPSVSFIDFFTREPATPAVKAITWRDGEADEILIAGHPDTGQPFLCIRGVYEYHSHDEHSGDDWLLHRSEGAGTLASICEVIWRRMARNVIGIQVQSQVVVGPGGVVGRGLLASLLQADVDSMQVKLVQLDAAQAADVAQVKEGGA
jgi:hypothetical protein